MNAKVFINYRREDTAPYAGRLYDRLIAHFGEDQVFIDIDQVEPGEDFVEAIHRKVSACDIAIVAIGPNWLRPIDASGKRRLDDKEDFVRMEIVAALKRKIRVIPVLVGGARMPGKQDLPEALAPLSRRNAIELSEARFHTDVNRLIEAIEKSLEKQAEPSAPPAAPPPEPAATPPVLSTSSIAPLKESKGWTWERIALVFTSKPSRRILQSAIVFLVLALAGVLMWSHYQKAAKQGNQSVEPVGFGKVAELYQKAADQGNANDQYNLGVAYLRGDGVPKDFDKARELFQKAADQGNADGQDYLGVLYARGDGVPKNPGKAAEFFQKAADQGNADAQFNLGLLYETGKGVPKDLGRARELYQKAVNQGYEPAITQLKALSGH